MIRLNWWEERHRAFTLSQECLMYDQECLTYSECGKGVGEAEAENPWHIGDIGGDGGNIGICHGYSEPNLIATSPTPLKRG